MAKLSDYVAGGRVTSEWKLNTNADVATSSNTYETVYSFTGAGIIVEIVASAAVSQLTNCIIEITVDGGALYEIDMGDHYISPNVTFNWSEGSTSNALAFRLGINAEFKTSILIRAKNDAGTSAIAMGVSASEDQ